jgi:predicted O-methyltransferase YrrM
MIKTTVKNLLCQTDSPLLHYWLPTYRYNVTPSILCYLCDAIETTRGLPGPILEIGCAAGATTIFLNKHMDSAGIEKPYICLDTFAGFTSADIEQEVISRGKDEFILSREFTVNSKRWFDKTMAINGIQRVRSIQADVNEFDFRMFDRISLCFVDVDLYRPVKATLEKIFSRMESGSIIAVDDCVSHPNHDGAFQAYREFVEARGLPVRVEAGRLGIIRL